MNSHEDLVDRLQASFDDVAASESRGQTCITASAQALFDVMKFLKEEHDFDYLVDITCVDYLNYRNAKDRFGLVYLLANAEKGGRLTVRVMLNEPDLQVASLTPLWKGANWLEREVWDMFGIRFEGHPDLRRILLPEQFTAHPLRKDYPLQGRGERHNFQALLRGQS